jgi:hypothetical protein
MIDTPKDKMVQLWNKTCNKTSKRLNIAMTKNYHSLPGSIKNFVSDYADYTSLVSKDLGVEEKNLYTYNSNNYLYFIFDEMPPLIMEEVKITFTGEIKVNCITKTKSRGFWPFHWNQETKEYKVDEEDLERIKKTHKEAEITLPNVNGKGAYFESTNWGGVLVFGNLRCVLSPALKKRLKELYFEAGKRVDLEIMNERIKETE